MVWDQALHKRIDTLMGTVDDTNKQMEERRLSVDARIETWAKMVVGNQKDCNDLAKRIADLEDVGNASEALGGRIAGLETSFFGDRGRHALLMGRVEALEKASEAAGQEESAQGGGADLQT